MMAERGGKTGVRVFGRGGSSCTRLRLPRPEWLSFGHGDSRDNCWCRWQGEDVEHSYGGGFAVKGNIGELMEDVSCPVRPVRVYQGAVAELGSALTPVPRKEKEKPEQES